MVEEHATMKDSDSGEIIIVESSDSSSDDDDDVRITDHSRKVARRGLDLTNLCSIVECKTAYPSSAIYSSKILKFTEQKEAIDGCINSMDPIELVEDDNDICGISVEEEKKHEGKNSSKREDPVNNADSDILATNKRRYSPSPPPKVQPVAKKLTRKTMKLLGDIERNKVLYTASKLLTPESPLLPENDLVDTSSTRTICVKFRWQCSIFRIQMKRNEKFLSILPELAQKCQVQLTDILLATNEETIQAEDSPSSIGLSSADIIDCYILNPASNDKNVITLLIQANDCKAKASFSVNQFSPLSELMEKYAKRRDLPLSKMKFKFDGDVVAPTDTPHDLGMENENCIDVVVLR